MEFLNRKEEMDRLDGIYDSLDGGLAVIWGRRRVGKTRLLIEWIKKNNGIYWVADESSASVQGDRSVEVRRFSNKIQD